MALVSKTSGQHIVCPPSWAWCTSPSRHQSRLPPRCTRLPQSGKRLWAAGFKVDLKTPGNPQKLTQHTVCPGHFGTSQSPWFRSDNSLSDPAQCCPYHRSQSLLKRILKAFFWRKWNNGGGVTHHPLVFCNNAVLTDTCWAHPRSVSNRWRYP